MPPYAKFYFLSNIFCSVSSRFVSRSPSSPLDRFPFFPVFRSYPAFFFSCRLFFPSPFFPAFSPPASFSYFRLSDTPLLFSPFSFNPFLHLAFGRFFSPCAFPPEHNISEHKPKHTDASFCRPKRRTRKIIKNLPVTTGMYKKHPTRPTKIPDLKTPAEQILSSPREIRKTTKNKGFPARTKHYPFQTANTATNAPKADSRTEKSVSACLHGHLNYLP